MVEAVMEREASLVVKKGADPSAARASQSLDRLAVDLVKLFKLLSDETRLRILLALAQAKEMHVRALCELLGQSQPAVSHHLALLRVAGLIDRRREGKHNFYHLVADQFGELLDHVFEGSAHETRQIRFKDYVLRHAPA